jgi:hypothetical protein
MSHFAKVVDNIVEQVIVAEQDFIDTLPDSSAWVQTSYNTRGGKHYAPNTSDEDGGVALRKNYAGVGYTYDTTRDAFYAPQPYPSWLLDEDTCLWDSPVPHPNKDATEENPGDGKMYAWDEDIVNWKEIVE